MTAESNARVLFVDDDELVTRSQLEEAVGPHHADVRLRTPEETILSDLEWSDLVVVDYFLTYWPERNSVESVARAPQNGLAVAASLRSGLLPPLTERGPDAATPKPVAFALWSGNLPEASFGLPDVVLPHLFARENNLEWAFRRSDLLFADAGRQVALLAHGVRLLPERWPRTNVDAEAKMLRLLGLLAETEEVLPDTWRDDARIDVLECHPPLHELSARSHGLALMRWLLHRIFPYPCFLLDELQLRARLRVEALEGGDAADSSIRDALMPYLYTGTLAGFDGPRWWRAGVEDWLFEQTRGDSGSPQRVADLARRHGAVASKVWLRPVPVIGSNLARSPQLAEVEETVRVQPDDWPVFADDAFALRIDVQHDPMLRALVDPADRPFLEDLAE